MGEEGISGLTSVEFEILVFVSTFSLPPPRERAAASVENKDFHDFPRDGGDSRSVYCAFPSGGAWRGLVLI
jgi:hypothetical protein